jgi:hypothetical protein
MDGAATLGGNAHDVMDAGAPCRVCTHGASHCILECRLSSLHFVRVPHLLLLCNELLWCDLLVTRHAQCILRHIIQQVVAVTTPLECLLGEEVDSTVTSRTYIMG